jgi:hypothetical protein
MPTPTSDHTKLNSLNCVYNNNGFGKVWDFESGLSFVENSLAVRNLFRLKTAVLGFSVQVR